MLRNESVISQVVVESQKSLQQLESAVTASVGRLKSEWWQVGVALGEIRDRRLYKPLTFEAYLASKSEWDMTRRHADRIISSARSAKEVHQTRLSDWLVPEIPSEGIARVIAKLPEALRVPVWKMINDLKGDGATAKDADEIAKQYMEELAAAEEKDDEEDFDVEDIDNEDDYEDENERIDEDEKDEQTKPKKKAKASAADLSRTSGNSPPATYKIVIDCDLLDCETVCNALNRLKPLVASRGNKYTLSLDPACAGEVLQSLGETLAFLKGSVKLTMKGVCS